MREDLVKNLKEGMESRYEEFIGDKEEYWTNTPLTGLLMSMEQKFIHLKFLSTVIDNPNLANALIKDEIKNDLYDLANYCAFILDNTKYIANCSGCGKAFYTHPEEVTQSFLCNDCAEKYKENTTQEIIEEVNND